MCYFGVIFQDLRAVVKVVAHTLKHPALEGVDLMVGIGLSGTMPLLSIQEETGIDVLALRKSNTKSHGGDFAAPFGVPSRRCRYVILDDFASTGTTLKKIQKTMEGLFYQSEYAGTILYAHCQENIDKYVDDLDLRGPVFCLEEDVDEVGILLTEGYN